MGPTLTPESRDRREGVADFMQLMRVNNFGRDAVQQSWRGSISPQHHRPLQCRTFTDFG